jgi:hypothetical protein
MSASELRPAIAASLALAALAGCRGRDPSRPALPGSLPPGTYEPRTEARIEVEAKERAGLIRRLRIRRGSAKPIEPLDLSPDPGDPPLGEGVACKFQLDEPEGTTPKFECVLADGEVLKVKYGGTPEVAAEVAATRLLDAFGFGADQVSLVRTLRCFGCPREPFHVSRAVDKIGLAEGYARGLDYGSYVDFDWVAAERKHPGRTIVAGDKGWSWYELDGVDARSGGATPAEVDALRLLAVFLAHWDNKPSNQRLVCPEGAGTDGGCAVPLAVVQDVGSTFGPDKVDLPRWRATPIWADPEGCRVSMKGLPYAGATFHDAVISEGGRALLADLLERLSRRQVEDLFTAARFAETAAPFRPKHPVSEWADAFDAKVREIRSRRCDGEDDGAASPPAARR